MKKIYSRPEWELTVLEIEDVISTSNGDGTYTYDPNKDLEKGNSAIWDF